MVFRLKPPERSAVPDNPLRRRIYYLVTSQKFDMLVTGELAGWLQLLLLLLMMPPVAPSRAVSSTLSVEQSPCPENPHSRARPPFPLSLPLPAVIVLNITTMATTFYKQPELLTDVQEYLNLAFTAAFLVEMLLKVTGERLGACRVPGVACWAPGAGCWAPGAGRRAPGAGCRGDVHASPRGLVVAPAP
jgi:hypothetical protein